MVKVISNVKFSALFESVIKKLGLPFKKSNLTSFGLKDYSQGHGQGDHRMARKTMRELLYLIFFETIHFLRVPGTRGYL